MGVCYGIVMGHVCGYVHNYNKLAFGDMAGDVPYCWLNWIMNVVGFVL